MSKEAILEKIKNLDEKLADKELSDMHSFFENAKKNLEKDLESLGGEEVKVVDEVLRIDEMDKPKNEEKPKATKKTPPKKKPTKKKPTKKKPTKDEYESAMADLKKKSGKTEEECLEIIEKYRALRKTSQQRKAKENKAKTKKNAEQKKRTDKLKEQGKLNEEGTLTPEAVIEQDVPKVKEKAEQEIEKIKEDNTPKPTKEEPKPKPTKQGEKKIKEGVKEVAEDTTKAIQEMLMAILGVVKNQEPTIAKASLIKLRDALTKEINSMAYGGLTDGAVANMNVTQSQMSAESVNPQMYAKGGKMAYGGNVDIGSYYFKDTDGEYDHYEYKGYSGELDIRAEEDYGDGVDSEGNKMEGYFFLDTDTGFTETFDTEAQARRGLKKYMKEVGYKVVSKKKFYELAGWDINDDYAKGGRMEQGYNDRMDESLGMRHRGHYSQSHKDRRDEAKGMNKGMGNRAYQSVGSMDKMAKGGYTQFEMPDIEHPKLLSAYHQIELNQHEIDRIKKVYDNEDVESIKKNEKWGKFYKNRPNEVIAKEFEEAKYFLKETKADNVRLMDIFGGEKEYFKWKKAYDKSRELPFAKGGNTQGYNDRMDESLGMRHRGHHSQSHKDRRDEAKGMNKGMGNRAYQSVGSMASGGVIDTFTSIQGSQVMPNNPFTIEKENEFYVIKNSKGEVLAKDTTKEGIMKDKGMFLNLYAKGGSTNANWIQDVVDSPNFDKGAFTRKAKNRGMTTMELMKDVLSNPNEYTLKTRRQAQFMKNAM